MTVIVNDVITLLSKHTANKAETVDTLICGDAQSEVTGVVVAQTASIEVIKQAISLGANLIITHEPIFYNHLDKTEHLQADRVFESKRTLIKSMNLAIFRCHDDMHLAEHDEILTGVVQSLGWESYSLDRRKLPGTITIPEQSVADIAEHVKQHLNIPYVRLAGDPMMRCSKIGLALGYSGQGPKAIAMLHEQGIELLIAGELPEWEIPEYIRDAIALGEPKAMLIIGHHKSEESGMKVIQNKLQQALPNMPVYFVETEQSLPHII